MRSRGEGFITLRSDGRWQAAIQVNGKRHSVYGRSRSEVAQKLRDLQNQAATGKVVQAANTILGEFLDQWLTVTKAGLRPSTWTYYESLARHHVKPALGKVKLRDLKPLGISLFYSELTKAGVSAHRALKVHRLLTKSLNDAVKWQVIPVNPALAAVPPKPDAFEPVIWTPEQAAAFVESARANQRTWDALALVALGSGCRLGEVLALRWGDVDLERGVVTISRSIASVRGKPVEGSPKTAAGHRTLSLPGFAVAALRVQRQRQLERQLALGPEWKGQDRIFTTASGLTPNNSVFEAFHAACRRAGVPKIRLHDLRHVHATLAVKNGADLKTLQRRLGHASLAMTMTIYAHAVPAGDIEAAAGLERALIKQAVVS